MAKRRNVNTATVVGAALGAAATPAASWAAAVVEAKFGIPAAVTLPLLGLPAALVMRWAAKLNPHD